MTWNNPDIIAPALTELSMTGIIFRNYYTYQLCNPSRAALMTGYYKSTNHMPGLNTLTPLGLTTDLSVMPQYFKKLGYQSHLVGKLVGL